MSENKNQSTKLGLIAGNGSFPLLFAKQAQSKGANVVCVAIEGETKEDGPRGYLQAMKEAIDKCLERIESHDGRIEED